MANKNKKNAASAAQQAAAQQAAPETTTNKQETAAKSQKPISVIQIGDLAKYAELSKTGNMDHNHIMDMIRVQHETFRMDPKAAEHTGISQDSIDKINKINAIEQVALMASVATYDNTPFAVTMRAAHLEVINEVAGSLGITIDQKALPAPDKNGNVQLPSTAIKVSKEAKEAIKQEQTAATKKVELDPSKVDSEEKLKESLLSILTKGTGSENLYDKVSTAINFYESYLGIQAGKEKDPNAARAALKEKDRVTFLTEITQLLDKCPFTISGVAKFMYENTERTKSPVVAFCTFRDASLNKKTGMPQIEDHMVADIVKVLICWIVDGEIKARNNAIAGFEKDIETLKKDEKANAKGIETGKKKIEDIKKQIESIEAVASYVNNPDRSIVDNFAKDYTDNSSEGFKMARMIGSKILKSYYGDVKVSAVKMDSLVHNLQQYMGVITNMFLPPLNQIVDYSEANITELEAADPEKEPEKNE